MGQVGNSSVANQANTTDGDALGVGAINDPDVDVVGLDVGDGGVVDLYHHVTPIAKSYIAEESAGYVLQEDDSKILLEPN